MNIKNDKMMNCSSNFIMEFYKKILTVTATKKIFCEQTLKKSMHIKHELYWDSVQYSVNYMQSFAIYEHKETNASSSEFVE